jgi:DNA-binding NtrC family response regulator
LNIGTTFKVYLPANEKQKTVSLNNESNKLNSKTTKKIDKINIVLLEDDLSLNQLFEASLQQKDYVNIFSFRSIKESMDKIKKMLDNGDEIHIIIADVIIKDGNSIEMVEKVLINSPNTKFLLISGHDREYLEKLNNYSIFQDKKNDIIFLQKPFSLDVIVSVVESIYKKFNN